MNSNDGKTEKDVVQPIIRNRRLVRVSVLLLLYYYAWSRVSFPEEDYESYVRDRPHLRNIPRLLDIPEPDNSTFDLSIVKTMYLEAMMDKNLVYDKTREFKQQFNLTGKKMGIILALQEKESKALYAAKERLNTLQRNTASAKHRRSKIMQAKDKAANLEIEQLELEIRKQEYEVFRLLEMGLPHEAQKKSLQQEAVLRTQSILGRLNELIHTFNTRSPRAMTRNELVEYRLLIAAFNMVSNIVADREELSSMIEAFLTSSHLAGVEGGFEVIPTDYDFYDTGEDEDEFEELLRMNLHGAQYTTDERQRGEANWIAPLIAPTAPEEERLNREVERLDREVESLNREVAGLGFAQRNAQQHELEIEAAGRAVAASHEAASKAWSDFELGLKGLKNPVTKTKELCRVCKENVANQRCCKYNRYCSRDCAARDWPQHKYRCENANNRHLFPSMVDMGPGGRFEGYSHEDACAILKEEAEDAIQALEDADAGYESPE